MVIDRVLAIETSCDDTSVAIVTKEGYVEALCSAHQDLAHKPFGGVVPEIACRNHTLQILPLIDECFHKAQREWADISGIAVTSRPGLVGALLVGLVTAKSLSLAKGIPFVGINHLEAHLWAPFVQDNTYQPLADFSPPFLALAISGGHTHLVEVKGLGEYKTLGQTIDDAAGEAFDKFAKMMGLGFPGGVKVDQLAQSGMREAFPFPRPLLKEDNYRFSFSGLKTAAQRVVDGLSEKEKRERVNDLCASYQEAIVDVLVGKLDRAAQDTGYNKIVLTGGVSANSRLRERTEAWAQEQGFQLMVPPLRYCTDNAAMVGYVGIYRLNRGERSGQDLGPSPRVEAW